MVKKLFMLLVLALGIGLAIPSTRVEIQNRTLVPAKDYIGKRLAPGQLDAMANQIDVRVGRGEGLPGAFPGWVRRDYSGPETDPWGRPWFMTSNRSSYTVGTMGPDGVQGTPDDITVTRRLPSR